MKRLRISFLISLLVLSSVILLAACRSSDDPAPETDETTDTVTSGADGDATDATTDPPAIEQTEAPTEEATEEATEPETVGTLVLAEPEQRRSSFRVVYDKSAGTHSAEAQMLCTYLLSYTGTGFNPGDSAKTSKKEIVLSSAVRPETAEMLAELKEGEYAAKVNVTGDSVQLLIAATTYDATYTCMEYLLNTYYTRENGLCIPMDLDVKGTEKEYVLIESTIKKLRDPCILVVDGVYYAYGTGWNCYRNTSGHLEGPWENLGTVASVANPDTDGGCHWAPEVHAYKGKYYMFTTYLNKVTGHRGCIILKSDSPEGPFVEITNGHITPADWDAIDGTLYVDPDGQPWMVFVHEWTSMPDGNGSFAAAKLSEDFTHFISEPIELFKAREPGWAVSGVTDGCWMYTTKEGELLMIWSNFDSTGYVVAVARSSNGRLDGEWIHEEQLLYSKYMTGTYDGGHGMIFTDTDGQMYLSFHSPNTATGDRKEKPVFLAIKEENGKLFWDEPKA